MKSLYRSYGYIQGEFYFGGENWLGGVFRVALKYIWSIFEVVLK